MTTQAKADTLVIIPMYNEKENAAAIIDAVLALDTPFDILVIDDNSPDGTAAIVREKMAQHPGRVDIIERAGKLGLGTAYIEGFRWGLAHGYEYICEMDADFSHNPKDLPRLRQALVSGQGDVAVGSRYLTGVNVVNWPMGRVLMSYYASKYVRIVTGLHVRDTTAGFVCYRADVLRAMNLDAIHFKGYAFQIEMKYTAREVKSSYKTLTEFMVEAYNEAEEVCQAGGQAAGVPTGFPSLDRMLMGFREGQLIIIGARPAVGKTSFALNLALNAAAAGYTVGFFSLEMSGKEIAQRLICAYAMISISDFRMGRISPEQWANINEATQTLSKLDILIDDTPGTTVTEIRAKSRRMLHNKEKAIIILDYLQLVSPPPGRRSESRTVEVSEMSRGLKIMAKELKIPLIALSQLSRQVESRTGKRPQLSDLRESGSIEQDADIVMFLDRSADEAEASRDDRPDEGVTRIVVAKNRSGPIGDVDLMFLPASTKFYELDGAHAEE